MSTAWHAIYVLWVLSALAVLLYIATSEAWKAWERHQDRRAMWRQVAALHDRPYDQDAGQ